MYYIFVKLWYHSPVIISAVRMFDFFYNIKNMTKQNICKYIHQSKTYQYSTFFPVNGHGVQIQILSVTVCTWCALSPKDNFELIVWG